MTFLIESRRYRVVPRERLGRKGRNHARRLGAVPHQTIEVGRVNLFEVVVPKSVEDDENQQRSVPVIVTPGGIKRTTQNAHQEKRPNIFHDSHMDVHVYHKAVAKADRQVDYRLPI